MPFRRIESKNIPTIPPPFRARLQIYLDSDNKAVPLMVRVASTADGHYASSVGGPAAVVEQMIVEPQT